MSDSIFHQLEGIRQQTVPAVLQSGTRTPNPRFDPRNPNSPPYLTAPTTGTQPLRFDIHPITANEISDADSLITELPPAIIQDQPSPTGRGVVQTRTGYDYEEPGYVARRQKQIPLRDAAICLYGCDGLRETTPGASIAAKAETLAAKVPAAILEWLKNEIGDIAMLTAVGEEEVASFLAAGSGNTVTPSSTGSRKRAPRQPKKPS